MARFYSCARKGGVYVLLGVSLGDGASRGGRLYVYRNTANGRLYHRKPADFKARMNRIGDAQADAGPGEIAIARSTAHALADLLESLRRDGVPLPPMYDGIAVDLRERLSMDNNAEHGEGA